MPGSEEFIQSAVHALEAGGFAVWIKRGAVSVVIIAIVVLHFYQFRGLSTSQGMDQAQMAFTLRRSVALITNCATSSEANTMTGRRSFSAARFWKDFHLNGTRSRSGWTTNAFS